MSAKTGAGLDALIDRVAECLGHGVETRDQPLVSNVRHVELLRTAGAALARAASAIDDGAGAASEEFVLADLQDASARLQEITGKRTTDDLLTRIFERFCIGK